MRHGSTRKQEEIGDTFKEIDGLKCIPGQQLGCYFCNDVTAPGNVSGLLILASFKATDCTILTARKLEK